jgi:hypothetical protein
LDLKLKQKIEQRNKLKSAYVIALNWEKRKKKSNNNEE